MKRSQMIRYLEGLLQASANEKITFRQKAEYILVQMDHVLQGKIKECFEPEHLQVVKVEKCE